MGLPKPPVTLVATLPHLWGSTGEAGDGAAEGARHLGGNSSPFMGKYRRSRGWGGRRRPSPWWQLFPIYGEVPGAAGGWGRTSRVTLVATLPHFWGSTGEAGDGGAGRAASPWCQLFPIHG